MQEYNYNFEIMANLMFFEHVVNDLTVYRYDNSTLEKTKKIKPNIIIGPKGRTLSDLKGQTDSITYPSCSVELKSYRVDPDRLKNNQLISLRGKDGRFITYKPIPLTMTVEFSVVATYRTDIDQVTTQLATLCYPSVFFSWREPKTENEIRSRVAWDGEVSIQYPSGTIDNKKDLIYEATMTFTIETYIYRTAVANETPICHIHYDTFLTKDYFCDVIKQQQENTLNEKESNDIYGRPQLKFAQNYYLNTETSTNILINGDGFRNTFAVLLSGNNSTMFETSSFDLDSNTKINAYPVSAFNIIDSTQISFDVPPANNSGLADVIIVNTCGYGKLTEDSNRTSRALNPYLPGTADYINWTVQQFPYINGLIVLGNTFTDVSCRSGCQ